MGPAGDVGVGDGNGDGRGPERRQLKPSEGTKVHDQVAGSVAN